MLEMNSEPRLKGAEQTCEEMLRSSFIDASKESAETETAETAPVSSPSLLQELDPLSPQGLAREVQCST